MSKEYSNSFTQQAHLEMEYLAVKSAGFTSIIGFVLSLIYGATIFSNVSHVVLLSWLVFMFVVMSLRGLSQKLLRQKDIVDQYRDKRFNFFKLMIIINGAGWGFIAIALFPANEPNQQMILVCLILGVAAGALSSMAPVIKVFKIYIILLIIPLIGRLIYENASHLITLTVCFAFYLVVLFVMASKIHASLFSSILLRLENEALLNDVFAAKGRAEQATQVKSRFMTNMSHELKTPMTGIVGIGYQLRQISLENKQTKLLQKLDESSSRLLFLIDNLLDFSELESGDLLLSKQTFNLKLMLEELVILFKPRAEKKGLTFHLSLAGKERFSETELPEWLVGDQQRLKQVLFNLLDNAIKFTSHGSINISLDVEEGGLVDGKVSFLLQFCVNDTGQGIDKNDHEKIFSAFQQADSSLTRAHDGTGVGLAIAKSLVDLMGGRIWCESIKGESSNFYVQVLLEVAEKPVESHLETSSDDQETLPLPLKTLIVDDNVLNRELLGAMLKEKNLEPCMAGDGMEALEILSRDNFDLIFMDIQMPLLDGICTTRMVRHLEAGNKTKPDCQMPDFSPDLLTRLQKRLLGNHIIIVAITANLVKGTKESCLDAGMDDGLSKPFNSEEIFNLIKNYFPSYATLSDQICDNSETGFVEDSNLEDSNLIDYRARAVQFLSENYHLENSAIDNMLTTLARSLSANFAEAQEALAENDLVRLGQIAHSLKGSLANIGFSELAEKARLIETSVSEQSNLPFKDMIAQLKDGLSELM